MATILSTLLPIVRARLIEPTAVFWEDDELYEIMRSGIRDLWRDIVDLKQEHYLVIDDTNVTLEANATSLSGVPLDVHKVYNIEPVDLTENGTNNGLIFQPMDYNDHKFRSARALSAIDPQSAVIYYSIHKQGAPVNAPEIRVAPSVTSAVDISFGYVPTLGEIPITQPVPIPGEADNAVVAWTVAFARSKEREDRSPDEAWLQVYATEKTHLLQSLGLRQYQEPTYVDAQFEEYW